MSEVSEQAAWLLPPINGDVLVAAVTSTAAQLDLTALAAANEFITVQADGCQIYILFGQDNTVTPDETDTSSTGRCVFIPSGEERSYRLDEDGPFYIGFKSAGADTGKIRVARSSPHGARFTKD